MKRVTRFDTISVIISAYGTTCTGKRRYANIKEGQVISFSRHRKPSRGMAEELRDKAEMTLAQFLSDFPRK